MLGRDSLRPASGKAGRPEGNSWWRISSLRLDGIPGAPPVGWTDVYVDDAYACRRRLNTESSAFPVLMFGHQAARTRARRRAKPARPYMVRLIILRRLICPSAGLEV